MPADAEREALPTCQHRYKTSTKGMYHWWTEPFDGTYRCIEICLDCHELSWSKIWDDAE